MRIRISIFGQGGSGSRPRVLATKIVKIFSWKFFLFIKVKICDSSMKDVQAEAFCPQKRTSNTSKYEISALFLIILVIFVLLDPEDPNQCGSGSTTLI
jgi:hypothetical protein